MPLTQFNYLFVIGTFFAFLDAWNIGSPTLSYPLPKAPNIFQDNVYIPIIDPGMLLTPPSPHQEPTT
jgi:hypothetical protein